MKVLKTFVLCTLLMFVLLRVAGAETLVLTEENVFQSVTNGESLFLLTEKGVLICSAEGDVQVYSSVPVITDITVAAYQSMQEEAKANVEAGITHILKANDGIWGLNAYAGLVGKIDADGVHFLNIAFDTTEWFNDDTCPIDTTLSAFVEDDTVYILLANVHSTAGIRLFIA